MRRIASLVFLVAALAVTDGASAATFSSQPYGGRSLEAPGEPVSWSFVSSEPQGDLLGGVAYQLSVDHIWHRCQQPGLATLPSNAPGTYWITIVDDYSPTWMAAHGVSPSELCNGPEPAGGNSATDSVTLRSVSGGLPLPINEVTPFEDKAPAWVGEAAQGRAEELTADANAQREALARLEAQRALQAQGPPQPVSTELPSAQGAAHPPSCVVPKLLGHTLPGARRMALGAHCRLGRVSRPPRSDARLVVLSQSARKGRHFPGGTAIAVSLGSATPIR